MERLRTLSGEPQNDERARMNAELARSEAMQGENANADAPRMTVGLLPFRLATCGLAATTDGPRPSRRRRGSATQLRGARETLPADAGHHRGEDQGAPNGDACPPSAETSVRLIGPTCFRMRRSATPRLGQAAAGAF
ncbi:MAG: hypothetical protein SNJ73_09765, partial [Acetobacteraceae bacterium]